MTFREYLKESIDLRSISLVLNGKKNIQLKDENDNNVEFTVKEEYLVDTVKRIEKLLKIKLKKEVKDSGDSEVYSANGYEFIFTEMKSGINLLITKG